MGNYINDGNYGTERNFPEQIQKRIDEGMGCGSSIGKGWLPIVEQLDKDLTDIDPDYKIDQIKEKFGGLRFYMSSDSGNNRAMYDLINLAEEKSYITCELCGEPGDRCSPNGWILTLCVKCKEDVKKR